MENLRIFFAMVTQSAKPGMCVAWFCAAASLACSISACVNPLHVGATVVKITAGVTGCCSGFCCCGGAFLVRNENFDNEQFSYEVV